MWRLIAFCVNNGACCHSQANGAWVVDLTDRNLAHAVIIKEDGATVYLTRDIAAAIGRKAITEFDELIYVAGATQDTHFQQLFHLLQTLGHDWASACQHVNFGQVQGMSTRCVLSTRTRISVPLFLCVFLCYSYTIIGVSPQPLFGWLAGDWLLAFLSKGEFEGSRSARCTNTVNIVHVCRIALCLWPTLYCANVVLCRIVPYCAVLIGAAAMRRGAL